MGLPYIRWPVKDHLVNTAAAGFRQACLLDAVTQQTEYCSVVFTGVPALVLDLQGIPCVMVVHNAKPTFWFPYRDPRCGGTRGRFCELMSLCSAMQCFSQCCSG